MNKTLSMKKPGLYHYVEGNRVEGQNSRMTGDCYGLVGDCTGIYGECTNVIGDFDLCAITEEQRNIGVHVKDLVCE